MSELTQWMLKGQHDDLVWEEYGKLLDSKSRFAQQAVAYHEMLAMLIPEWDNHLPAMLQYAFTAGFRIGMEKAGPPKAKSYKGADPRVRSHAEIASTIASIQAGVFQSSSEEAERLVGKEKVARYKTKMAAFLVALNWALKHPSFQLVIGEMEDGAE